MAVTIILLVALLGVVAFGLTRLQAAPPSFGKTPSPAAVASRVPLAAGVPADQPTQQTIQDVIRKLDDAQAQAIANGDQRVMEATATPDFYQEQIATNQELVAAGVIEVKLLNLEWGDVLVNGTTAVAMVYETWQTSYTDGTTQQSRDLNVYTLTRDSSRGWIVQADDHPDQPPAPAKGTSVPGR